MTPRHFRCREPRGGVAKSNPFNTFSIMDNNNNRYDKIGDKAQDLKNEFREKKEQFGQKANEIKNDLREKREQVGQKVDEWKHDLKEKKEQFVDKACNSVNSDKKEEYEKKGYETNGQQGSNNR